MKNLQRRTIPVMSDITGIVRKCKICSKWCHSGNPLSEAVISQILGAKNNWQPEWWFPNNAFENDLPFS